MCTTIGPSTYVPQGNTTVKQPNPVNPPVTTDLPNPPANPSVTTTTPQTNNIPSSSQITSDVSQITAGTVNPGRVGGAMDIVTGMSGGTGTLGLADPNVPTARTNALAHQGDLVDWSHPNVSLNNLTQLDSDQGVHRGGNDAVRCGAAVLVGGMVLQGPERTREGIRAVENRAEALYSRYTELQNSYPVGSTQYNAISTYINNMDSAMETLHSIGARNPSTYTLGDISRIQEAVYTIALCDQRLSATGEYNQGVNPSNPSSPAGNPYLTTGTLQTYRDLMWRGSPQIDGVAQNIYLLDNGAGGGHFVLGDASGTSPRVGYNPWTTTDGTSYVRSEGSTTIHSSGRPTESNPVGRLIDSDPTSHRLPRR